MIDFMTQHAFGPTGGLVLLGVIVGAGSGWAFSRQAIVTRDRERIAALESELRDTRAECAVLWSRLLDAVRDPGGAAVRQLESVADARRARVVGDA